MSIELLKEITQKLSDRPEFEYLVNKINEEIKNLESPLNQKFCWWSGKDIKSLFESMKNREDDGEIDLPSEISEEDIGCIADSLQDNFDASIGINWDDIEQAIRDHFRGEK